MKSILHTAELFFAIPLGIVAAPVLLVVFAVKAMLPSGSASNKVVRMPRKRTPVAEGAWTRHAV